MNEYWTVITKLDTKKGSRTVTKVFPTWEAGYYYWSRIINGPERSHITYSSLTRQVGSRRVDNDIQVS